MNNIGEYPRGGDVLLTVGTRKGTFLFWSDPARRVWRQSHHHDDWAIHSGNYDERTGSVFAASNPNFSYQPPIIMLYVEYCEYCRDMLDCPHIAARRTPY